MRRRAMGGLPAFAGVAGRDRTTIGSLGCPRRATVDSRGLVTPWSDGWSLDWWVGAEDRWYFPGQEEAVRQGLVDACPVVETAMRVPGGDAVHRAYAVPAPQELAVVEIENRTPVPFVVALVVRPCNPSAPVVVERIRLIDRVVTVDGRPALLLPKGPSRTAGSTYAEGDVAQVVTSGQAETSLPDSLRCRVGLAQAAFLFPLPHTAVLRVAMPLAAERRTRRRGLVRRRVERVPGLPSTVPSSRSVARGWKAQTERGMRLVLPEGRVAEAVEASRRFLLLFHDECARIGPGDAMSLWRALDQYGFHREAAETTARFPELRGAPDAPTEAAEWQPGDRRALDRLTWLLETATPTYAWPEATNPQRAAADFLSLVRGSLVRETSDGGLALCSMLPDAWVGQGIEVHDAPTSVGRLSFALRWHGDRPALLWELDPHPDHLDGPPVTLTAPGLDPSWSSTDFRGEALLDFRPTRS